MDFWRGGEYAYTYGNVHVRTQWGRIWYNRATGSDRAADANLGLHTGGSTTFVHHGWADIRGFGFPLRCATDEIPESPQIIGSGVNRTVSGNSARVCDFGMEYNSSRAITRLRRKEVALFEISADTTIRTSISPTPPKIQSKQN